MGAQRRRWTSPWFMGFVIACVVAIGALACYVFPILTVSDIEVRGTQRTMPDAAIEASGVALGDNAVRVDTASAARGVASLPWVKGATVGHSGLRTVTIDVTERRPLLFSHRPDGTHLADESGEEFVIADPPPGTIEITGLREDDPKVYATVATAIKALERSANGRMKELESVEAPSPFEITLHFTEGRSVYWGSADDADNKAHATSAVLTRGEKHWNVSNPTLVTTR